MRNSRPRKTKVDKSKPKQLPPKFEQIAELIKNEKTEPPKKRGRKKRTPSNLMKPEDVINYMIRTYPKMQLDKIKDDVLNGLKKSTTAMERLYVLDELIVGDDIYYCDSGGTVLNDDAHICGFVIDSESEDSSKKPKDSSKELSDKEISDKKLLESKKEEKETKNSKFYKKGKTQDKKAVKINMFYSQSDNRTFKQTIDSIEK